MGFGGAATIAVGMAGSGSMTKAISEAHAQWLESRAISVETAAKHGLHSIGSSLAFPYLINGEVHNTKVRKPGKSFTFTTAGKSLEFWNSDALLSSDPNEPLIITEGEMDALACLDAGFGCVVSVPNGAAPEPGTGNINPFDDSRCSYLWRDGKLKREIAARGRVILAVDADEPGRVLQNELVVRIGRKRCFYVAYPDGCKDANDVLLKHGRQALWDVISKARPYVDDVVPFYEAPPEPETTYYGLGLANLDNHLKLRRPEVCVVTGTPNAGKSQFVRWITLQLATLHGLRSAFISFEENREQMHRAFQRYCAVELQRGVDPVAWINRHIHVMLQSDDEDMTVDWIEERAWIAVRRFGCHVIVVDPWGDIDEDRKPGESYTEWTNRNLRKLVKLAKRLSVILIIVAHPRKVQDESEINLYDISGSAHFRNKCDTGIVISRPDPAQSVVTVSIQKSRDQEKMGTLGDVTMMWDSTAAAYRQTGMYYSAMGSAA
jgi:twinkle protein